jgi:ligand-binding SRPBCC domain-containing protein
VPTFDASLCFPRPLAQVFEFFRDPANLVRVSPPQLHMRLVQGPERIAMGSRLVFRGRRWGIPQRVVSEVTAFEPNVTFTDEQREGPFRRWVHVHRFEAVPPVTRVTDHIDYEPPGGVLGLVMTGAMIERDLEWIFAYRTDKLKELLGDASAGGPV